MKVIGPSWSLTNGYGYDAYGRMSVVSNGIYSANYSYLANSDLLQTTISKSNTTPVLTATRIWEAGPRLRSIANTVSGAVVTSQEYQYDALDRRKAALLEDGSRWQYDYDDRNELTGGRRYWSDWSPVAGQQFRYDYDSVGNRQDARSGGDTNGWNLRETDYTANNLNQYSTVVTPGYSAILGVAFATNTVTVNSASADRKTEYFHNEVSIANSSAPVWESVSISSGGSVSNGGFVFPKNSQTLSYDDDGNLTFDGIWAYDWDCENRLAAMTMTNVASIANSNRLRLEFVYDRQGRRVSKTVKSWSGSLFASAVTTKFVYELPAQDVGGWNLLASLTFDSVPTTACLWGLDLSGTTAAGGGIGGLSCTLEVSGGQISTSHFAAFDANGNVTALVQAGDSSLSARYEYSPSGRALRATGSMAQSNPFRFSTKFTDNESGLLYYGQRFLNADLGRWINRDPLGEQGGENLFAFIANKGLNNYDPVGTTVPGTSEDQIEAADIAAEMGAEGAGNALNILMRVRKMALASNAYQRLGAAILGSGAAAEQEEYGMMESFLAEGNAIIAQGIRSGQRITTVLGRYKTDMYQFFDDGKLNQWGRQWQALGHNILSIAKDVKDPARLSANFQWLAQAVARGDRIYIATKVTDIGGETYPMELDFLKLLGYVREGDYMVRH